MCLKKSKSIQLLDPQNMKTCCNLSQKVRVILYIFDFLHGHVWFSEISRENQRKKMKEKNFELNSI